MALDAACHQAQINIKMRHLKNIPRHDLKKKRRQQQI